MTASEQARADSMADAETLRLALHDCGESILWNTRAMLDWMRAYLPYGGHAENPKALDHVSTYAGFAARAAFLAVPRLRGER